MSEKSAVDDCTDWNGDGFQAKTNTYSGDSGGPTYYTNDKGNHFIVGIVQAGYWEDIYNSTCQGNNEYNRAEGYQAEALVDTTFYDFGSLN